MAQFLITYDLHNRRQYGELYKLMAAWNATKLTESNWLASLNGTAEQVRDIVASKLDNDDTVAVLELKHGSYWATLRVSPAANAWLSAYMLPAKKAA